jgi:hypothetical protein
MIYWKGFERQSGYSPIIFFEGPRDITTVSVRICDVPAEVLT